MIPTPLHPRTAALCKSYRWKDWAGYCAVCSYDTYYEREYFAFRHAAGLLDVTPLFKVDVVGPDAAALLAWVMARDIRKLGVGRVVYCAWTDHQGKMLDDGTVTRLSDQHFRVTSADPALRWFERNARGFDAQITDTSRRLAALALQGPTSRDILNAVTDGAVQGLGFFRATSAKLAGAPVTITRTGYTGDLGYEIWMANDDALRVWDALIEGGRPFGIMPAGLDALDVTRVEAGFILAGVDYRSARTCMTEAQTSTPYEVDLGWTVNLDRDPFIGQEALRAEKARGHAWATVGLDIDWVEIERAFEARGLPPALPSMAWRTSVPLYSLGRQVGYATSGAWSPTLKKNLALATVPARYEAIGTELDFEISVDYWRRTVKATVVEKPFFNPARKRA